MSTEADKLRAAKALIEDQKNWTTDEAAKDAHGLSVGVGSPFAVCFCARGAAWKIEADDDLLETAAVMLGARKMASLMSLVAVNDGHITLADGSTGHPAVMKIYDKAIELAEASQ